MRKIFLFMNVSLDGYFEGPGHDIRGFTSDFEPFSDSQDGNVDTLLYGHRTYDMMKFWGTPEGQKMMPEVAKFISETEKVVASREGFEPGWQKVTVIAGDVIGQVRALKEKEGETIAMFGSNELCVSLMQAGLVDEFQIIVNPVVFGAGTTLFAGLPGKLAMKLASSKALKSGAVLSKYVPREQSPD